MSLDYRGLDDHPWDSLRGYLSTRIKRRNLCLAQPADKLADRAGLGEERQEYPDLPVGLDGMRLGSRVNRDVYHLSLEPRGPSGGRV